MARKKQETLVLFPEVMAITRKFSDEQFGILMRSAFSYRFGGDVYSGDDVAVDTAFQAATALVMRLNTRKCEKCIGSGRRLTESSGIEPPVSSLRNSGEQRSIRTTTQTQPRKSFCNMPKTLQKWPQTTKGCSFMAVSVLEKAMEPLALPIT